MPWTTLALRVALLMAALWAIWRGVMLAAGPAAWDPGTRLVAGAAIAAAVLATVVLLLRLDHGRRQDAGHHHLAANVRAFCLGAALWLLPALAGAALCIAMGWSSVGLLSPPGTLLAALPVAVLGVFLLEAFPEELALRGYLQGLLARKVAPWMALLLQAALFTAFAWSIGALGSTQQWMFIPCLGLILGYVRALTGNVWAAMGVHAAWMGTAQLASAHLAIDGLPALQLLAFALLPSATIGTVLGLLYPRFRWRRPALAAAEPLASEP